MLRTRFVAKPVPARFRFFAVRWPGRPASVWRMVRPLLFLRAGAACFLCGAALSAQDSTPFRVPSAPLAAVVDAPLPPSASVSPDRTLLLLLHRPEAPSLAELAQPELRLAGLRLNPATNGPSRPTFFSGVSLKPVAAGPERKVGGLPAGARIADLEWSKDGRHLALTVTRAQGIELWVVDVSAAKARRLTGPILNAAFGDPLVWLDTRTLVVRCVLSDRGPAPRPPPVPPGPVVQENIGRRAAARTYEDLLRDAHDEALFDYYATSQLAAVTTDGAIERYPGRAIYTRLSPSPDSRYLLVDSLRRPYSYLVPAARFPTRIEVLERGRPVHVVADLPLAESMSLGGVRGGPRSVVWRADAPATLAWFRSLERNEVDPKQTQRDGWFTHAAPFTGAPVLQQKLEFRGQAVTWGDDHVALLTESWQRTRTVRLWQVKPSRPGEAVLVSERSSQDRYKDPGRPILTRHALGRLVMLRSADGSKIYFTGAGASPEGDRPFVDEFDLRSRERRRLWRSRPPWYEEFVAFTDDTATRMITRRESTAEPANYFLRSLGEDTVTPLTAFPNPYPQFAGVTSEVIRYKRADGVALSGRLYLPAGYTPGDRRLPVLLWAYPREYLSPETAEQVGATPERFARISPTTALPFVLAGYAVLDDPAMPIIGRNGKPPNDTYVTQLVASARAAVDELVRRGVADPKRIAVGGHSYGAFMTANLLAHSRLFRAGIARSGAYNRTLTPFGFQAEQRTFWQAPAVYNAMSPFNVADKVRDPLLLMHGSADNNSGTFPIQSERFYTALKAHGATTRFVLFPHESHAYRARETLLHMLWEMETWLNTHLAPPVESGGG